jgi:acyl-CoA synthetase (AMP-forming)/AMP-acid ligase II
MPQAGRPAQPIAPQRWNRHRPLQSFNMLERRMTFDANLVRGLQSTIRHNGPKRAILDGERTYTWSEFGSRVVRLAGALHAMGVGAGSRFAILSRNGFRAEELKWAGLWLGAVPVPVNWRLAAPEIAHILRDADCLCVFAETEFCRHFSHPSLREWSSRLMNFGSACGPEAPSYESLLERSTAIDPADPHPDDDAILLYTGGTTGCSKGVRLSHTNILTNALQFGLGIGARRHDVYLHAAPMFHSGGLLATSWLLLGAAHCYLPAYSPQAFLELIERRRVTAVIAVPTMLIEAVRHPAFSSFDTSSVRALVYGSAPMSIEWVDRIADAFPHAEFANAYGLTEATPILSIFDAREMRAAIDEARRSGRRDGPLLSVGKPNLLNELRVIGGDGREVGVGEVGEIVARGPNIMNGYLNLPEETRAVLHDGWLRTGDIGRIDEEGYVYVLDRAKDMLISGGENVYSAEVEAALNRHPAVAEAAVIGVPDERLGETIMAVIVPAAGARPTPDELTCHCRDWLGGFKVPRRFAFVETLPRSALGKVLKTALRRDFVATSGAGCGRSDPPALQRQAMI